MSKAHVDGWLDPRAAEGMLKLVKEALEKSPEDVPPFWAFLEAMHYISGDFGPQLDATFLDVGCGVGGYADLIGWRYPCIRYAGCDISPHMIELAERHFGQFGYFFVCDALDLEQGEPDIILASGLLETCMNWQEVLRHLLSLDFHWLILNRVRAWNNQRPTEIEEYITGYHTKALRVTHNWLDLYTTILGGRGLIDHLISYQVEQLVTYYCIVIVKEYHVR